MFKKPEISNTVKIRHSYVQLNSGSYLFHDPSDQTDHQSISFNIEYGPHELFLL